MVKIYRKTATIKAEQFNDTNDQNFINLCDKYGLLQPGSDLHFELPTLEGLMKINYGDWIATGVNGEHWVVANDVFKKTYAELPVIPDYVADYLVTCKDSKTTLFDAIYEAPYCVTECVELVLEYISYHAEVFARAWLDGYQMEDD